MFIFHTKVFLDNIIFKFPNLSQTLSKISLYFHKYCDRVIILSEISANIRIDSNVLLLESGALRMKPMGRLKIGINERKIIECIGSGFILIAALTSPNLPRVLMPFVKKRGIKWIKKLLKQLEDKNVVNLSGEKILLTKKGKKLLNEIYLSNFTITKNEKWDGLWRLVSYDVPEKYKKSRNIFRNVLEQNGFHQVHKSLWVSPYDCKEEIAVFCKNLNMINDVIVMTTDHLPNQEEMVELFEIKK